MCGLLNRGCLQQQTITFSLCFVLKQLWFAQSWLPPAATQNRFLCFLNWTSVVCSMEVASSGQTTCFVCRSFIENLCFYWTSMVGSIEVAFGGNTSAFWCWFYWQSMVCSIGVASRGKTTGFKRFVAYKYVVCSIEAASGGNNSAFKRLFI